MLLCFYYVILFYPGILLIFVFWINLRSLVHFNDNRNNNNKAAIYDYDVIPCRRKPYRSPLSRLK